MIRKHIQEKIKNPTPNEQEATTNNSFSETGRQRNTWKKDRSLSWKSNKDRNTTNRRGYNSYRSTQHDEGQSNHDDVERPQLHHRQRNSTTDQAKDRRNLRENFGFRGKNNFWR